MKNLWKKEFQVHKTSETAESILREQCTFLSRQTNGKIVAKVAVYDGITETNFVETIKTPPFRRKKIFRIDWGRLKTINLFLSFLLHPRRHRIISIV